MARGKLEAQITIPAGGYDFAVVETGGGDATDTISLTAASTYYHSSSGNNPPDLPATLKALLDANLNATYTVTIDATDGGTGKYTISATGGGVTAFAVTWTDSGIRDILGWSGNLSGALTYTGTEQAESLWLPDCPHEQPFGDLDEGWDEFDSASTQSPAGDVVSTAYNNRIANSLRWQACTDANVRATSEAVVNTSFERFYRQSIFGAAAWSTTGGPVKWHPNADGDSSFTTYKIPVTRKQAPTRLAQNWSGLYTVEIPRLVKVPGS